MTFVPEQSTESNPLSFDVWGRPIRVAPLSMLSGLFTYGVDADEWRATLSGTGTVAAVDGELRPTSPTSAGTTRFVSARHPRYQANRGHHFATATVGMITKGRARWGLFTAQSGVFFEYDADTGIWYACRRTTTGITANTTHTPSTGSPTVTTERVPFTMPADFNPSLNTLWDITFQWRGAGDVFFYVNQRLVATISRLNVSTGLGFVNPAAPVAVEVENTGTGTVSGLAFGCFDVSVDGGTEELRRLRSAALTASRAITGTNVPLIAVQAAGYLSGLFCTRDSLALRASAGGDQNAIIKVWLNPTVNGGAWSNLRDESALVVNTTATSITGGRLIASRRVLTDDAGIIELENRATDLWVRPIPGAATFSSYGNPALGDILVLTCERETGAAMNAVGTLDLAEEV